MGKMWEIHKHNRKIECIDYKHFMDIEGKKNYYRYEMINEKMVSENILQDFRRMLRKQQ